MPRRGLGLCTDDNVVKYGAGIGMGLGNRSCYEEVLLIEVFLS